MPSESSLSGTRVILNPQLLGLLCGAGGTVDPRRRQVILDIHSVKLLRDCPV